MEKDQYRFKKIYLFKKKTGGDEGDKEKQYSLQLKLL